MILNSSALNMPGLFKSWRRRRILSSPFPTDWHNILRSNVRQYRYFNSKQLRKLGDCTRIMVHEKFWEGTQGLKVTDEIKVTIAGTASMLVLGFEKPYYFGHLKTILVFPGPIHNRTQIVSGQIVDEDETYAGQAWQGGPLVFSWPDVLSDSQHSDGRNVVIHEFAHHIDGLDGEMGGIPPMRDRGKLERWRETVKRERRRLEKDLRAGRPTILDPYASLNAAEFFAVASEHFFETPVPLKLSSPELYALLADFYLLDPASWGADSDAAEFDS